MQQENIFEIKLSRDKDNTTRNKTFYRQYNKEVYLK